MTEVILYILAGGVVGFAVGLTGVGGGSLMTPLLILFNYPVPVAIGTDLLYAAITKSGGVIFHQRQHNIRWRVMGLLAAGSIPVSLLLNLFVLDEEFRSMENYEEILTTALGIMLVMTALVIAFRDRIQRRLSDETAVVPSPGPLHKNGLFQKHASLLTLIVGMLLGLCVTLSSVGAGAFGAAVLFMLYPRLRAVNIVGTDIAHAVPLTLVAGLGYLYHGLVDFRLLASLACGSLPGIYLGTHMGSRLPEQLMRNILIVILGCLGVYFTFGSIT